MAKDKTEYATKEDFKAVFQSINKIHSTIEANKVNLGNEINKVNAHTHKVFNEALSVKATRMAGHRERLLKLSHYKGSIEKARPFDNNINIAISISDFEFMFDLAHDYVQLVELLNL